MCHWISVTVEDYSAIHDELWMVVGRCRDVFFAEDGMIGSRDPERLQGSISFLIGIFLRVSLMANEEKSNTMTFYLGEIQSGMSEEAFSWSITGEGATFWGRLWQSTSSLDCGV